MRKRRRETVEVLPVRLIDARLELAPHGRSWIRGQQLELRGGRAQRDSVIDRCGYGRPVVLQEPEDIERRRHDAKFTAFRNDSLLMVGWDRSPAGSLQRLGG